MSPALLRFELLFDWTSKDEDLFSFQQAAMYPTFACTFNDHTIYRIIDHQLVHAHRVSIAQLWRACGLTVTEGLFLFDLRRTDYETDFAVPFFPFRDVWVTVPVARMIAQKLAVEDKLTHFLDPALDKGFSHYSLERGDLIHNWKVDSIPDAVYSTRAIIDAPFYRANLLPNNRKVRTQIARTAQPGVVMRDRMEDGLILWQVTAYEEFVKSQEKQNAKDTLQENTDDQVTLYEATWDAFQGILCDVKNIDRPDVDLRQARVLSDSIMLGNMPLRREYLAQSSSLLQVYTSTIAAKIAQELAHKNLQTSPPPTFPVNHTESSDIDVLSPGRAGVLLHERMDVLEHMLQKTAVENMDRSKDIDELNAQIATMKQQIHEIGFHNTQAGSRRILEILVVLIIAFFGYYYKLYTM
ncbi:unnamed protein product [Umbelopsis ramanniana]